MDIGMKNYITFSGYTWVHLGYPIQVFLIVGKRAVDYYIKQDKLLVYLIMASSSCRCSRCMTETTCTGERGGSSPSAPPFNDAQYCAISWCSSSLESRKQCFVLYKTKLFSVKLHKYSKHRDLWKLAYLLYLLRRKDNIVLCNIL